jgi:hypothetical protein
VLKYLWLLAAAAVVVVLDLVEEEVAFITIQHMQ